MLGAATREHVSRWRTSSGRYRKKRDFGSTPEPRGSKADAAGSGRFVVQEHHARRLHWDLRLEHDGALASWALPRGVPAHPDENRLAVRTEDHPLEYLEFEGEIPKGEYGAGTMRVWDTGTFEAEKFRDDEVIATFHGERVRGRYALFRTRGNDWLIHRMDPPEDPAYEPLPERLKPMLARLGTLPRDEDAYGFEVKWDGIRALAYFDHGHLSLQGRNFTDFTARYPELRELAAGARGAPAGARRRGGGPRRAGPAELRAAAVADAPGLGVGCQAADARPPGDLRDLRPPLPRRPLHAAAALRGAPCAARAARARGAGVAHAGLPPRRGQRPARRHRADGRGGRGGQAARLPVRAGTARFGLDQGEERAARRTW